MSHTFLTYFVPWPRQDFKGSYVPTIYNNYTNQYIELTKKQHKKLSDDFDTDYVFVDDLEYCFDLFTKYDLPRFGPNDLFNIKFLLMEEHFKLYDTITYIDFDVVQIGTPNQSQIADLKSQICSIRYTDPMPGYLIHNNVSKLCDIFNIKNTSPIWQNNNGVFTFDKEIWNKLDYINTLKEIYSVIDDQFASELCDESLFNFIRIYKDVEVTKLDDHFNQFARHKDEYENIDKTVFQMIHFSKDTGKEVLKDLLFNPLSVLY